MTSIAKLKDRARKHEQNEDWKAAIEVYLKVLETEEADDRIEIELGLYNRVGDLYLRLGQTDEAVTYYEKAADKYADSGFFNNAIALCNKALRHRPDRPQIYLKLSRFCNEQGFLTDARRWIVDYAERQVKRGQVDAALAGLHEFAETSGAPDVRELLAQHLAGHDRNEEAVEQLRMAHAEWVRRGDDNAAERVAELARTLDPDVELDAIASTPVPSASGLPGYDDPLIVTSSAYADDEEDAGSAGGGLEGLETHRVEPVEADAREPEAVEDGLETFTAHDDVDDDGAGAGVETMPDSGAPPEIDEDEPEPLPLLDAGFGDDDADTPEPLPLLDTPADTDGFEEDPEPLDLDREIEGSEEEAAAIEAEAEPAAARAEEHDPEMAEPEEPEPEMLEPEMPEPGLEPEPETAEPGLELEPEPEVEVEPVAGLDLGGGFTQDSGGIPEGDDADEPIFEAMDLNLETFGLGDAAGTVEASPPDPDERAEVDVDAVLDRAKELVGRGLSSEAVRELQLISRTDASPNAFRQALSVLNEIIRQDPDDIGVLQRRVEFASRTGDRLVMVDSYADLAEALERTGSHVKAQAMYQRVLGLDPDNTTALEATAGAAPTGDEDGDMDLDAILREMGQDESAVAGGETGETDESFAAMLDQFKSRVTEQSAGEDAGDHYDLGLAFKEMGLIDEAIGEFQVALTGGEERLKVYEELGQCFMLKGQFNVALKILKRALQAPHEAESDLLGVYYHMGQCHQELGDRAEARAAYEKVLAIHPEFGDVTDRVGRL